jgi:hypothetical protein
MNFMKTTLMTLRLLCLTLFFASAFGAEPLNRRLEAAPDGVVTVDNTAGSVDIRGWSRDEVEVTGELGPDVEELVFERDGNEIVVRVRSSKRHHSDIASDLVIRVPEKSAVNVSGISSDVTVRDVRGAQRLNSISGDIDSYVYASDIDVETISGDVAVQGDGDAGYARLNSVSGDLEVHNLAGEIGVTSVSGDVTVVDSRFDRVQAETVSSDMVFHSALTEDARLDMETINGDLEVVFEGDLSARFDIETFNGDIRNCFGPKPVRTSQYTPGTELKFAEGEGSARVTIRTLNGGLRLCKD